MFAFEQLGQARTRADQPRLVADLFNNALILLKRRELSHSRIAEARYALMSQSKKADQRHSQISTALPRREQINIICPAPDMRVLRVIDLCAITEPIAIAIAPPHLSISKFQGFHAESRKGV